MNISLICRRIKPQALTKGFSFQIFMPSNLSNCHSFQIENLILFEDNHLIVLYKPPTVLTQPDISLEFNLLNATKQYLVEKYAKKGNSYLGMVHRIDRPCSGIIVFAKTSKCASRISDNFRKFDVEKKYVCVAQGILPPAPGTCAGALPSSSNACNKYEFSPQKYAMLEYSRILSSTINPSNRATSLNSYNGDVSLVDIKLHTGRKHQIRIQLAEKGHPIIGDTKYSGFPFFRER